MSVGTVKWFNTTQGYRCLEPEDQSSAAFAHTRAVQAAGLTDLQEGQKVSFELEAGKNGKTSAANLVLA